MKDNLIRKSVLLIVGPTGSGKSAIGILTAQKLGGEIISADARQIYKYLDIGTAKPSKNEMCTIRHHFIDLLYPDENYNAGLFGKEGREVIDDIWNRGKIPIVVGGSGLYIQSLIDGFFECPPADDNIREILDQRMQKEGPEVLLKELKRFDPVSASKMLPSNTRRIIRAMEVYLLTGIPISELQKRSSPRSFDSVLVGLSWDRKVLYDRINKRVDEMIEKGLLEEVRNILSKGYTPDLNSLQTVGYAEVFRYFNGELEYKDMINLIKRNSRRYAKRQITWFRRDKRILWYTINNECEFSSIAQQIADYFKLKTRAKGYF
mgnify:FL=1